MSAVFIGFMVNSNGGRVDAILKGRKARNKDQNQIKQHTCSKIFESWNEISEPGVPFGTHCEKESEN